MAEAKTPHRYPDSLIGPDAPDEVLAWKCKHCGEWIDEKNTGATSCGGTDGDEGRWNREQGERLMAQLPNAIVLTASIDDPDAIRRWVTGIGDRARKIQQDIDALADELALAPHISITLHQEVGRR